MATEHLLPPALLLILSTALLISATKPWLLSGKNPLLFTNPWVPAKKHHTKSTEAPATVLIKNAQIHAIRGFYNNKNLLPLNNFNQKACIVKGFLIGLVYICPLTQ
jgi:hypothetical protein